MTSVDGFTRGSKGHIKYNKDTKKRRHAHEGDGDEDVEMVDATPASKANKKRRKEIRLGHEFKAKVSHLGKMTYTCLIDLSRRREAT